MEGTIVEFTKEHGTGRVAIDGVGELPFDAAVSRAPFDLLVPGRRVQVELGPSRLGGQRVVKIGIPGTEPPPPPASTTKPIQTVQVGPYELRLTDFWVNGDVVEKPGLARFNGVAAPGVSFDFTVLLGAGADTAERAKVLAAFAKGHAGAQHTVETTDEIARVPFERHSFESSPALEPGSVYELNVGTIYDDLLLVGYGIAPAEVPKLDAWRRLFASMAESAIVLRPPPVK